MVIRLILCKADEEFLTSIPGQGEEIIETVLNIQLLGHRFKTSLSLSEFSLYLYEVDLNDLSLVKLLEEIQVPQSASEENKLKGILKAISEANTKLIQVKESTPLNIPKSNVQVPKDIYVSQLTWDFILSSFELDVYLLLHGPTGSGKTAIIYAAAQSLGYDFYPINCGTLLKPEQSLIGSIQAKDGSTFIVEAEFLKYYTSDKPTIIFLNELNRTPQIAANYMMTILDKLQSYLYVKELGKRIYKSPTVKFIADCNIGKRYTDTRTLDAAFLNRFLKIDVDYLSEEEEVTLIKQKVPNAKTKDITTLVRKGNLIREQEDELMVSISTRELIEMSKFLSLGFSVSEIVEKLVKNIFIDSFHSNKETISKLFDSIS